MWPSKIKTCAKCKKQITGTYFNALGTNWHKQCFTCAICKKPVFSNKFSEKNGNPYHLECYLSNFSSKCAGCNKALLNEYTQALNKKWHKNCFTCTSCKTTFKENRFLVHNEKPYCNNCYSKKFSPKCSGCKTPITENHITAMGKHFHSKCFRCKGCNKSINTDKFAEKNGFIYHIDCYSYKYNPKCSICLKPMVRTYFTNSWGESYCQVHKKEFPTCYSCGRLIHKRLQGKSKYYNDGRSICGNCNKTSINTEKNGLSILNQVKTDLSKIGYEFKPVYIPLRLTDQLTLKKISKKKGTGQTAGMTCTNQILKDNKTVKIEVTNILILNGLPKIHFCSICAHELTHAWLFLNNFRLLPQKVEEGLCTLSEYLWLKHINNEESKYRIQCLLDNPDQVYGDGFRLALESYNKFGLKEVLFKVKKNNGLIV